MGARAAVAKPPTARRYAEALFALAREQGAEEAWAEALSGARDALSEPTAVLYFSEPRIARERKLEAVALLAEGYDRLIVNFLGLLVGRQATSLLPDIVREYGALLSESAGRIQASVATAAPLSDRQRTRLTPCLGAALEQGVALSVRTAPEIIGGMVVRVGDQVIDGSVRTRLAALRRQLAHGSLA